MKKKSLWLVGHFLSYSFFCGKEYFFCWVHFISKNISPGLIELYIKNVLVEERLSVLPGKVSQYVSQFTADVSIIVARLLSCNGFRSFGTDLTNNKT